MNNVTRRPFAKLSTTVATIALGLIVTSAGPLRTPLRAGTKRVKRKTTNYNRNSWSI